PPRQENKGVGLQQRGGPYEPIACGRQQRQQGDQGRGQRGQPQPMADGAEQPAPGPRPAKQVQQRLGHQRGVRAARQLAGGPQPQPAQPGGAAGRQQERGQPQQQGQQMDAQQRPQGRQYIDGTASTAGRARRRGHARDDGGRQQAQQAVYRPLPPACCQVVVPFALRQQARPHQDAGFKRAGRVAGLSHRVGVFQRAPVFFAQADDLCQPVGP